MWIQDYDPPGSWPVSTMIAALPVLVLLGLLASGRVQRVEGGPGGADRRPAWWR